MKILLPIFIFIIALVFIVRKFIYSAKRNLFKDQSAWSGKDIKIKYKETENFFESDKKENYLKFISDEAKIYLEEESKKD
tara:strand:+ start:227 stop:466 length:240 start_codon:yes stop_codon:yes gene_type:complete